MAAERAAPPSPPLPKVVVVEGLIGAGKSTFLRVFTEWLCRHGVRARAVVEDADSWVRGGHLQRFYDGIDDGRECYIFQTFVHVTRAMTFEAAWTGAAADGIDVLVVERWPTTDRHVFMANLAERVGTVDMAKYKLWWDYWNKKTPARPDCFVYVRPSIEECMARCRRRARDGESNVKAEYQAELLRLHDKMLGVGADTQASSRDDVIVLEGNDDFKTSSPAQEKLLAGVWARVRERTARMA
jgi:deoxyadenosine/deoxycytidine kinase